MKERELHIYVWIHHIATVIGVVLSLRALWSGRIRSGRKCVLCVFLMTQIWAVVKIITGIGTAHSRLKDSLRNIEKHSNNTDQARGITAVILCAAVLFKVGTPLGFPVLKDDCPTI